MPSQLPNLTSDFMSKSQTLSTALWKPNFTPKANQWLCIGVVTLKQEPNSNTSALPCFEPWPKSWCLALPRTVFMKPLQQHVMPCASGHDILAGQHAWALHFQKRNIRCLPMGSKCYLPVKWLFWDELFTMTGVKDETNIGSLAEHSTAQPAA